MAISLVGDAGAVRGAMNCSAADFSDYCAGRREPPWPEFDRLVDLLVREQGKLMARNRAHLADARSKLKKNAK